VVPVRPGAGVCSLFLSDVSRQVFGASETCETDLGSSELRVARRWFRVTIAIIVPLPQPLKICRPDLVNLDVLVIDPDPDRLVMDNIHDRPLPLRQAATGDVRTQDVGVRVLVVEHPEARIDIPDATSPDERLQPWPLGRVRKPSDVLRFAAWNRLT
jgi:hypothetical protein